MLGLINGAFYAVLSLGLALIFGLLNVINFTHGAQYMLGAYVAWLGMNYAGVNYWLALLMAPVVVGIFGIVMERLLLRWLYQLDHLYGLLLTFGLALIIEGGFRQIYGISGQPYAIPAQLTGARDLGFMFLPNYRAWVVVASLVVCLLTWLVIKRQAGGVPTRRNRKPCPPAGLRHQRAAHDHPYLRLRRGSGRPGRVLAAPIYQVKPTMGADIIIVVFAVVVVGGMGSIMGSVVTGFLLGLLEGLTKVFYPEASNTVIFVVMAIVLLIKPAGLFGKAS